MGHKPMFSIVTINYNNASGLERTLRSLIGHDLDFVELIIIDGFSYDGSRSIIDAFSTRLKLSVVVSEPDHGIYDAMNKGLHLASGEFVAFLNSGDELFNYDFSVLKDVVCSTSFDGYYSNVTFIDQSNNIVRTWLAGKATKLRVLFGWMPPHPMFFIKRSILLRLGGFNLKFKIASDYDLLLRCFMSAEFKVHYLVPFAVGMEVGGISNGSLSGIIKSNYEVLMSWRDLKGFVPFWIFLTKPLSKLTQVSFMRFWRFF
jgi:glycosyltransferase